MSFKNNTCPRCKKALTDAEVASIKRREWRGGAIGMVLGLIGAGLGVYFGTNA